MSMDINYHCYNLHTIQVFTIYKLQELSLELFIINCNINIKIKNKKFYVKAVIDDISIKQLSQER